MWLQAPPLEISACTWQAEHSATSIIGPSALTLHDRKILEDLHNCIGETRDTFALVDQLRKFTRNNADVILSRGRLPFGAEVRLRYTHRYSDGFLRLVSDLHIPKGVSLRKEIQLGSFTAVGPWPEYQVLRSSSLGLELSPRQELPAAGIVLTDTISCVLWNGSTFIEFGIGADLWRWAEGIGDCLPGSVTLRPAEDGVTVERRLCQALKEPDLLVPERPTWRYSSYLSWGQLPSSSVQRPDFPQIPLLENGKLDRQTFARTCADAEGVTIDFSAYPWTRSQRRSTDEQACFTSKAVVTRAKTLLRQLNPCLTDGMAVCIVGLKSGFCEHANHLERRGTRDHWDHCAIHELSLWIRQYLGERPLILPDEQLLPSCASWFRKLPDTHGL